MAHITFIHGIANKPPEDELLKIWRNSLAASGLNLGAQGVSSSMIYWADVMYESPVDSAEVHESLGSEPLPAQDIEDEHWRGQLTGDEKDFVDRLATRLAYNQASPTGDDDFVPPDTVGESMSPPDSAFERIPVPWSIKRRLMKAWLRDVHHYLFDAESAVRGQTYRVRQEIRGRFVKAVEEGSRNSGPHVLMSHSMGTVIAYDCLKRVVDCPAITSLMTIGSPLGLDEIQDKLKPEARGEPGWSREDGFPSTKADAWVNVFDKLDPVAGFDARLANDYQRQRIEVVTDINEQNHGKWRHSIDKYLSQPKLVNALRNLLEL